jgi:hypothetical protein
MEDKKTCFDPFFFFLKFSFIGGHVTQHFFVFFPSLFKGVFENWNARVGVGSISGFYCDGLVFVAIQCTQKTIF